MGNSVERTLVNLDGLHSLGISVYKERRTVIAELIVPGETPIFIYAEKFNEPCNYMKTAIKKGIVYLNGERMPEEVRIPSDILH